MSIYLDEKNPGKHKPFEDASPDIVEYVRYLEVIAGKSANTAFSYFCDLRGFKVVSETMIETPFARIELANKNVAKIRLEGVAEVFEIVAID